MKKKNLDNALIEKIEILSDDEKRGWFRFWTLESDGQWCGSWMSSHEYARDKRRILDLIFFKHIKTNFSGGGVMAIKVYMEDGVVYNLNYVSKR